MNESHQAFWRRVHGDAARWRTAVRKEHRCDECRETIHIGEFYFDTAEVVGVWKTAKLCVMCADKPVGSVLGLRSHVEAPPMV